MVGVRGVFVAVSLVALSACGPSAEEFPEQTTAAGTETTPTTSEPSEPAPEVDRVALTISVVSPSPLFWCWYYIAEPLGFYEKEGLDVEINPIPRGGQLPQLALGNLDASGVTSSILFRWAEENEGGIKLLGIENLYPFFLLVLEDSDVTSAQDLVGTTIGVREAGDETDINFLMGYAGVERGNYETLPTGGRGAGALALTNGDVSAHLATSADEGAMIAAGVNVRRLPIGESASFYDSGPAVTVSMLEERPDVVVRFGRALAKAFVWVNENPEHTIELLSEVAPEAVEDPASSLELLRAYVDALLSTPYEAQWSVDPALMQDMIDTYAEVGVLDASIDVTRVLDTSLLDEIWAFDVPALQEAARNSDIEAALALDP